MTALFGIGVGAPTELIRRDRQINALHLVVDLGRHPLAPLPAAHVSVELGAEQLGPGPRRRPPTQRTVLTAGDDPPAVGAEGHAGDGLLVALDGSAYRLTRCRIPEPQTAVVATGDDPPPVVTEGDA